MLFILDVESYKSANISQRRQVAQRTWVTSFYNVPHLRRRMAGRVRSGPKLWISTYPLERLPKLRGDFRRKGLTYLRDDWNLAVFLLQRRLLRFQDRLVFICKVICRNRTIVLGVRDSLRHKRLPAGYFARRGSCDHLGA